MAKGIGLTEDQKRGIVAVWYNDSSSTMVQLAWDYKVDISIIMDILYRRVG